MLCLNLGRHAEIFPPGEERLAIHVCRLDELVHRDLKIIMTKLKFEGTYWRRKTHGQLDVHVVHDPVVVEAEVEVRLLVEVAHALNIHHLATEK